MAPEAGSSTTERRQANSRSSSSRPSRIGLGPRRGPGNRNRLAPSWSQLIPSSIALVKMRVIQRGRTAGLEITGLHQIPPGLQTRVSESPRMCVLADESKRTKLASNKTFPALAILIRLYSACVESDVVSTIRCTFTPGSLVLPA